MPTLPCAAGRGIVHCYRHAAGALTSLAFPLACAKRPAIRARIRGLEERVAEDCPCILCLRVIESALPIRALYRGCGAVHYAGEFLARRLGESAH